LFTTLVHQGTSSEKMDIFPNSRYSREQNYLDTRNVSIAILS